jgi:hypothetical protein
MCDIVVGSRRRTNISNIVKGWGWKEEIEYLRVNKLSALTVRRSHSHYKIGMGGVNWIYVHQERGRWGDPVNMVIIIWVALNAGNFFAS